MANQPEQSLAQFEAGAKKLGQWGSLLISLAGGEPLLRDDLPDIVRAIGRYHFPFVTTNGYLATPALASELFEAGLWGVSVSIDYADPVRHNRARGNPDAYEHAVSALKYFSAARRHPWQRVNLMCVLLDDNLDQVEPLIKLAADYDAYFMIQPYCQLKTGSKKFIYKNRQNFSEIDAKTPEHHQNSPEVSNFLLKLRRKYPNFLSNPSFLSRFDLALTTGIPHCAAGKAFFNIDSTGDIAICVEERPRPVTNLYTSNCATIKQKLNLAAKNNHCQKCWYNCRGEVETLYNPLGLLQSLPTLLFDTGKPTKDKHLQNKSL